MEEKEVGDEEEDMEEEEVSLSVCVYAEFMCRQRKGDGVVTSPLRRRRRLD